MLNKLLDNKGKKSILVALIVAALGWAGLNVSESDVNKYVNMAMPDEVSEAVTNTTTEPISDAMFEAIMAPNYHTINPREQFPTSTFNEASHISPQRRTHILYGDATGGGHLYGIGKPCKSEFPQTWNKKVIIKEVERIAANDNLDWKQQRNGYYVTEQQVGTVNVRVVKGRDREQVITAYPTNVERNACPSNDNY